MGVQRYPDPPLVPSSMSAGGELHSSLAQSAPGSQPVTPMPDPSLNLMDLAANQGLPVPSGPTVVVSDQSGRVTGNPRPSQGGSFGDESYGNAARWRKTPSSS